MGSCDQTASVLQTETATGSHLFTVCRYSLTKGTGIRKYISSDVGGYKWTIKYYPDGYSYESANFISFYLGYQNGVASDDKVQFSFTILRQNGDPSYMRRTSQPMIFRSGYNVLLWGFGNFVKRTIFEASECLIDDAFTVKCTVTIVKGHHLKAISQNGVVVPPSNLKQNLVSLLESGEGADVTFFVKEEEFNAHWWMLAARSDVFKAELFGGLKEKCKDTIEVDDIEPTAFKYMLHFIYSDSLPDFEGNSDDDDKTQYLMLIQHLLVAADRYQLERLRLMCENLLGKNLHVSNVATTLILAERHNFCELKVQCLGFMNSLDVFKAVAWTDGFHDLMKIFPSILKDM